MTIFIMPLLLGAVVDLHASTNCPSRDEVASELARLAGVAPDPPASESHETRLSAEFGWVGESLSIVLRSPQGVTMAERTLAREGSCSDLAVVAAVVIAAWQGEMRADLGPELPAAEGVPRPRQGPPGASVSKFGPGPGSPPPVQTRSWLWEFGAAILASREDDFGPGMAIDAQLGPSQSGLAGRLGVLASTGHALALGPSPGRSLWSRAALDLGLRKRAWFGDGALDGHVALEAGLIRLEGTGYSTNYVRTGFDLGLGAGIRGAWTLGRLAPFVELDGSVWPGRKAVAVAGTDTEGTLPRFELRAAAGVSFGRFR
jgi:hypothetical protein